jgi:hypothetical protein
VHVIADKMNEKKKKKKVIKKEKKEKKKKIYIYIRNAVK